MTSAYQVLRAHQYTVDTTPQNSAAQRSVGRGARGQAKTQQAPPLTHFTFRPRLAFHRFQATVGRFHAIGAVETLCMLKAVVKKNRSDGADIAHPLSAAQFTVTQSCRIFKQTLHQLRPERRNFRKWLLCESEIHSFR